MKPIASGHTAVMARRVEPPSSLDYFPTPPWSTRALCECILGKGPWRHSAEVCAETVWEPAAGEGHMSCVLAEYFRSVWSTDVHDYGCGYPLGSFVGQGCDVSHYPNSEGPSWVITNPPFSLGIEFARRALAEASVGVALLLRSNWMESRERYELFCVRPPHTVAVFAERVPMTKGRWDPEASTATSYSWFIWRLDQPVTETRLVWIPPGQRKLLERPGDRARFAA